MRGSRLLKIVDRWIGVPVVAAMGVLPHRPRPSIVRKVGVLRTAAIGDTLLLRGVLSDIRCCLPSGDLVLITGEGNAEAGELVTQGLARHVVVPIQDPFRALSLLRCEHLDIIIDTGAWPRLDALFARLSGSAYSVGFRTSAQHRHYAFDQAVVHAADVHESENFRRLVQCAGFPSRTPPSLQSVVLPDVRDAPIAPYTVFHPWAGGFRGHLRQWPNERWVALAQRLREFGTVVITGAREHVSETEFLAAQLRDRSVPVLSFAGRLTLAELAALLRGSRAVVSVNTGVMHLAALLGAPTVCLDGPSSPRRWGPVGPRAMSVCSTLPRCGFLHLGFEYHGQRTDCMLGIEVDAVEYALRRVTSLVT